MDLFSDYWPWWLGAICMAVPVVGVWWTTGRPLGAAGIWSRALSPKLQKLLSEAEAPFANDPKALKQALLAATAEEFGQQDELLNEVTSDQPPDTGTYDLKLGQPRPPWGSQVVFLVALIVGGLLAALLRGTFAIHTKPWTEYSQLVADGPCAWIFLLFGGFLVGVSSRMAGGCTSGHGLSGIAWLQPSSIVATSLFFGIAVACSFCISYLARAFRAAVVLK